MDSLLFTVNAVLPLIIMVAIGYVLKKIGFMNADFAKAANKMIFRLFLPSMLFLNVYKINDLSQFDFGYFIYVILAVLFIFTVSLFLVLAVTKERERRGALLQACFRSNYALIGIPLAQSLFGQEGVTVAALLSAVVIPLFNTLAVVCLSVFRNDGTKPSVKKILLGIVKNPLIQSVFLGLIVLCIRGLFIRVGIEFRLSDVTPIYSVLTYLSGLATPLALLVLGAQFEFSAVASLKKEIIFGTLMRTVVAPLIGVGCAYLLFSSHFTGAHFAAFVSVFSTPVSVSSVPMAQEMKSDTTLAGQLVVWTTFVSAFTIFIISFILRSVGIF